MIKVVNKNSHTPTDKDIYIGRGSVLGNPYTGTKELSKTKATYQCDNRTESIEKYEVYLRDKISKSDPDIIKILSEIETKSLNGEVNLVCFCKPKKCHGDIIKQIVEGRLIKKYFNKK